MLQDVMRNSRLLVPVKLTAYGEIALQTLIFMLVCLPASSLVLQFILEHLNDSFSTLASLTDHRSPINYPILNLIGIALSDLVGSSIYIYHADRATLYGTYPSYSQAIMAPGEM
jgi:predicted RNA-binding protein